MKVTSLASLVLAAAVQTVSASYPITGAVSGINTQTGQRPMRQPILKFQDSGPAFDLFVQAVQAWQGTPQDNMLSWYQVGGV